MVNPSRIHADPISGQYGKRTHLRRPIKGKSAGAELESVARVGGLHIDTSGKRPREHAVKPPGRRKVDHYRCVPRSRSRVAHCISRCSGPIESSRARCLKPPLTHRFVKLTSGPDPTEFWRTTAVRHPQILQRMCLQNPVLGRQILILQQEFLIDQSGNVSQEAAPMCFLLSSISIIEHRWSNPRIQVF
jgi:hypothetical protein